MNVRVEVELQDATEREWFEELVGRIYNWRSLTAVERHRIMHPERVVEPDYTVVDEPTNQVRYEGPAPAEPASKEVTDAELEQAITTYWKAKGLPAAKQILASFGVERVGAIPAEKRAEALLAMGF